MSLFSVLNVANRGLSASQMGLDVTGQNIANASTEGYSRKRITQSADYRHDAAYGQMGLGVEVENVVRIRDSNIDVQIQRQNHQLGYYTEMDSSLESIENILNEPSETGIISYIDEFFDSWNNLSSNPADLAARTMVRSAGQTLSDVFHNVANELDELQLSKNLNVASVVKKVNRIAKNIFNLNKEIASVELSGQNANDSRDSRDQLMKDLALLVDYDVIEAADGQISITVGGNLLLSPVTINELELYSDRDSLANTTYLQHDVKIKGVNHPLKINGGELKALMDARDISIPNFRDTLDKLAISVTETINEQHRQGYNLNGYNGFDFFDPTVTGAEDIDIAAGIIANITNIAAAKGGTQTSASTNNIPSGAINFGNAPIQLSETLTRPWVTGDAQSEKVSNIINNSLTLKLVPAGTVLKEGIDYSVNYVNGTIQMLHNGYDTPVVVPPPGPNVMEIDFDYMVGNFPGPGNNENSVEIAKIRERLTMTPDYQGNFTSTFTDFYSGYIGDVGLERTEAASNMDTRRYLIEQYENTQESIAGVSLDEEMANLIKFQHTYQAAAKIVSTTQQMLDVLMNI